MGPRGRGLTLVLAGPARPAGVACFPSSAALGVGLGRWCWPRLGTQDPLSGPGPGVRAQDPLSGLVSGPTGQCLRFGLLLRPPRGAAGQCPGTADIKMDAMLETPELPAVFDGVKLAAVAAALYVIVRCLNLKSPTAPPDLYFQDSGLSRFLLKSCPLLTKERRFALPPVPPAAGHSRFTLRKTALVTAASCDRPEEVLRALWKGPGETGSPVLPPRYIPPLIWGKSGHIQTALYGKMGRVRSPHPYGHRKFITMSDGATSTFDLFEPLAEHCVGDDVTMVICPGIANHSEKQYIRTFVDYAQKSGYRCAVLNHLGALPNIELTSPRMFTYGCTWEFGAMVSYIKRTYPLTQLAVVGFSLGGNIVCKYLGETQANQEKVLCCVSVCQGYSALRAQETFMQWDQCRRFYNFLMADNMKKIILSHRCALPPATAEPGPSSGRSGRQRLTRPHGALPSKPQRRGHPAAPPQLRAPEGSCHAWEWPLGVLRAATTWAQGQPQPQALFGDHVKKPQSLEDTDLSRLYTATSLMQIDDNVMRKFHGYTSLKEYYEEESCMRYLHRIHVPLMLVNAADDPLVHESLLAIPKSLSAPADVLPLHPGAWPNRVSRRLLQEALPRLSPRHPLPRGPESAGQGAARSGQPPVSSCRLIRCLAPAEKRENVMFVLPLHGGHLGFFEGSVLFPEPLTWMDKLVVEYANAICQWERNKWQCSDAEPAEVDAD
ncbi:Monoacylglycerol lipase ABHD2 [Galemys pyrenaicus]|uniref:Monoacylglycerol lipase ABHD2 n=1 Tax=Galemys pyrenaicus TaxID=202257 RepID=A0A8J6DNR5_GALPY|nr:Monoacylglycerol lipase ABHD2 [Galemys pyrenaicus]